MAKILSIVSGNPSGSLNIAIDVSNYLKSQGYEVIDIFRKYNNTDLKGIIVIHDRCTIDYIISLAEFIRHSKPDLVIVHGYSTHIWTKLAVALSKWKVKLIHVEHNTEKYTPFRRYLMRKMEPYTDKYICVSKGVAKHLIAQGIDKSKVDVIYNGIDIDSFNITKEKQDVFTVGMVARFSKQKDQMTLIKAVEYLVQEKNEELRLILMGVGKTKKKCEQYVREHHLESYISFVEGDIKKLLVKLDVFVLATHYEGLPLVLCETMAAKVPVIATNVPGVDEIVLDGKTGLLVNKNDVQDLANKIKMVKDDKVLAKKLLVNAWQSINEKFEMKSMYKNYINAVERVIEDE